MRSRSARLCLIALNSIEKEYVWCELENRSIIYQAIIYQAIAAAKQGKADFADYLIGALNHHHGVIHTVTFDRKLKTVKRFKVLD